jgi:hypothetical protein
MDYVTPLSRDQGARALSSLVCRQVSPVIAGVSVDVMVHRSYPATGVDNLVDTCLNRGVDVLVEQRGEVAEAG